jgi:hypothetical protein
MTVRELKALLSGYDDELEVAVTYDAGFGLADIVGPAKIAPGNLPGDPGVLIIDGC